MGKVKWYGVSVHECTLASETYSSSIFQLETSLFSAEVLLVFDVISSTDLEESQVENKVITSQFHSQPSFTHQMYSLSFTGFFKQYRIKKYSVATGNRTQDRLYRALVHYTSGPGFDSRGRPNIFNSVLFKACERERIHLMRTKLTLILKSRYSE